MEEDLNQEYVEVEEENVPREENYPEEANRVQKKPFVNNSGQNSKKVPRIIKEKFNWGACLLNWIWGINNRVFITLWIIPASFIPILPIVLIIWFGFKGNEWAWQKKRFQGVKQFHEYQKKWAIAGIIVNAFFLVVIPIIFAIIGGILAATQNSGYSSNGFTHNNNNTQVVWHNNKASSHNVKQNKVYSEAQIKTQQRQAIFDLITAANKNYGFGRHQNIDFSSEGLAEYFSMGIGKSQLRNNYFTTSKAKYIFNGNSSCDNQSCNVIIIANRDSKSSYPAYIRLSKEQNGKLTISDADKQKYMGF